MFDWPPSVAGGRCGGAHLVKGHVLGARFVVEGAGVGIAHHALAPPGELCHLVTQAGLSGRPAWVMAKSAMLLDNLLGYTLPLQGHFLLHYVAHAR